MSNIVKVREIIIINHRNFYVGVYDIICHNQRIQETDSLTKFALLNLEEIKCETCDKLMKKFCLRATNILYGVPYFVPRPTLKVGRVKSL